MDFLCLSLVWHTVACVADACAHLRGSFGAGALPLAELQPAVSRLQVCGPLSCS